MLIPNDEVLKSIVNLNKLGNKDWSTFSDWFYRSYLTQSIMLIDMDDPEGRAVFVGRCRELKEQTYYLQNAEEVLSGVTQNGEMQNPILTAEESAALVD